MGAGADKRSLQQRLLHFVAVGLVPTLLIAGGSATFVLNHFYARVPYLLDSGWYSALVYRAGFLQDNPQIACNYAEKYYGVHVSPFLSLFSILSYLAPVDRVEWYAFFQAIVFVPTGIATYWMSRHGEIPLRRLPLTALAAAAFAVNGQSLMCIGYPHYEPAISGFICLVLVAVVTGRPAAAWLLLLVTASVREDAGFHASLVLGMLVLLKWRRITIAATMRTLVALTVAAFAASVLAIIVQKAGFHSANLLREEYLGDPIFNHVTWGSLRTRASTFIEAGPVIWIPMLATMAVAAVARDPRYLLGWVATSPWLILNCLARQEAKVRFDVYTGFPFIVSIFWVYVYGLALAPPPRKLAAGRLEVAFLAISLSSVAAFFWHFKEGAVNVVTDMISLQPMDRTAIKRFARAVGEHRGELGKLLVDHPVAALQIESFRLEDTYAPGVAADTVAFHRGTPGLLANLGALGLDHCVHGTNTPLFVCSRAPIAVSQIFPGLRTSPLPTLLTISQFQPPLAVGENGLVLKESIATGIVVSAGFSGLKGHHVLELGLDVDDSSGKDDSGKDDELALLEVVVDDRLVGSASTNRLGPRRRNLAVRFDAAPSQSIGYRLSYRGGPSVSVAVARVRPTDAR